MTSSLEQLLLSSSCPTMMMKIKDWEEQVSSDDEHPDFDLQDTDEDEHLTVLSGSIPKLQPRGTKSKARWDEEMRMAEVLEYKSKSWVTTGIIRNSKTYLLIEEAMFMVEQGALVLINSDDDVLSVLDMYLMVREQKNGCCWDSFQTYKCLKSLGYIIGRHGVQWTFKKDKQHSSTPTGVGDPKDNSGISIPVLDEGLSITDGLREMHINNQAKPTFDVYLPNNKFKKSSPGELDFVVYLTREDKPPSEGEIVELETRDGSPLSKAEFEELKTRCNGAALLISHVDHGPHGRVQELPETEKQGDVDMNRALSFGFQATHSSNEARDVEGFGFYTHGYYRDSCSCRRCCFWVITENGLKTKRTMAFAFQLVGWIHK